MDTGTKLYRNYFPIKFGWQCDCQYGRLYPCFRKLMYPGDVFKVHADLLIRYQPMLTPPMNEATATVRFAFVPLRLIEELTELIVTGSKEGKLSTETIPVMDSVFDHLDISSINVVQKHSILDELYGIPVGLTLTDQILTKLKNDKASPAAYFAKALLRFYFDYYRDENFSMFNDFEEFWLQFRKYLHYASNSLTVMLKKDRITSSLPWQLKSIAAPTIDIISSGTINNNFDFAKFFDVASVDVDPYTLSNVRVMPTEMGSKPSLFQAMYENSVPSDEAEKMEAAFQSAFNGTQNVNINNIGINAAQFREMMAQTRIFERLARCGSRYTEYLRANFGIAPVDGTLQRAQYLGGFKTHIVTTEVVQTAADGQNPVGTLRGHGITHGTSNIKPFMAREIGVMIGVLNITPEIIYAQGVDRELTVRSRFDFLNPSFQHLSEQEVRAGEVYFGTDVDENGNLLNSKTWGFQPYAQEYRTGIKHVVGDMRDSLSYWNQALIMSSRPSLNYAFLNAHNHTTSFNRPFAVSGTNAIPMIVDFGGLIEAYRPLVKNGTPGLLDHN